MGKILRVCTKPSNKREIFQENGRQIVMVATERSFSNCFRTTYSSEEDLLIFETVFAQRTQFKKLRAPWGTEKLRYRSSAHNLKLLRELLQSFQSLVNDRANKKLHLRR